MWRRWPIGCGFAAILAALGWPAVGHAAETRPVYVWYRSTDGCPDGEAFLGRLAARNVEAKIAQVGDPIDFVVTLGRTESGAEGLLEKQDATKTVAIRRLSGDTCEHVADAIALGLVLAGAPTHATESPSAEPAKGPTPVAPPPPAPSPPATQAVAPLVREHRPRWSLGAQGGVTFGLTPEAWPGGALFVELEPQGTGLFRDAAFRLWAAGASTSSSGERGFRTWNAAGRLEACPIRFGSAVVYASPCAAFELGVLGTSTEGEQGRSDHGVWAAVSAAARLAVRVAGPVALEAQVSGVIPLNRYEFVSDVDSSTVYRASAIGVSLGAGVSVRFP